MTLERSAARWFWTGVALASALSCALYADSLDGEMVYDDNEAILMNPDVKAHGPLAALLRNDFWGTPMASPSSHRSFRPVTVLSYRWTYLSGAFLSLIHI